MKKLLTLSLVAAAFVLGSFTGFAQQKDMEKIYEDSKKKAYSIAEEVNLDDDETLLLIRQITSREQTLAKVEINQSNPNSTQDYSKYIEQANEQFKKNVGDLFGKEKSQKILSLYKIEE